ncbi:MAG TPA: DUF192 domain-containing protein [Candidatus Saccharimonadales bacterium]|nr:DUF192 domain-containing protein [Candidatus Saccharimonadales bacterium]
MSTFNWRPLLVAWIVVAVVVWEAWPRQATTVLAVGTQRYKLETITTPQAMIKGLGGRTSLARNAGMLFAYDQSAPNRCFWMRGMRFPLDIMWLDTYKRVVHVEQGLSPKTYPKEFCAPQTSQYVIELNAGEVHRSHIGIGQTLSF